MLQVFLHPCYYPGKGRVPAHPVSCIPACAGMMNGNVARLKKAPCCAVTLDNTHVSVFKEFP